MSGNGSALSQEFEKMDAQQVLKWAVGKYHPRIALASSFGAEDVVIIDMISDIKAPMRVFTIDTGRLHQETYDLMDEIGRLYGLKIDVYYPEATSLERMVRDHGVNLFYKSVELRQLCCQVRKVEPFKRAVSGLDAWIAGLRREQSPTRRNIAKVEVDRDHNSIIKVNPLADWTNDMVWEYIRKRGVPYNRLHDKGYPSIGCAPCTRAILPGENLRAGRWWWENNGQKECGLHRSALYGSAQGSSKRLKEPERIVVK